MISEQSNQKKNKKQPRLISLFDFLLDTNTSLSQRILIGLVQFYGISTIVGYLMPNPVFTYTLDIYDL